MVLNIIQTVVNAAFLLLAVLLISDRWDNSSNTDSLTAAKKELHDVMQSNLYYLEGKANRIAESSDSYQVNTNSRINVLENRMQSLESRRKDNPRITNSNTNVVNGSVPAQTPTQNQE
jgi:hypothetical protein